MKKIMTAMITPFTAEKEVDFTAFEELLEDQIKKGIDGFIICGTTAEVPTLSKQEKLQILDFAIAKVNGRIPIWYGCGSNCTRIAIANCQEVENREIAGVLLVTPYYNRPSQEGLYEHFKTIAQSIHHDIMLYNIPSRTGCTLECQSLQRLLRECPNIVALKHADKDLELVRCIKKEYPRFQIFSGEDGSFVEGFEAGMDGIVSVMSHIALPFMKQFISNDCEDSFMKMLLYKCAEMTFLDASPSPIKYMLYKQGKCENELRLPLVSISTQKQEIIDIWLSQNDNLLQGK